MAPTVARNGGGTPQGGQARYAARIAAPTPTRRSDAARNRRALIEAAREAYREEGLAVGVDRIARRAGVGTATLYRHFATRDQLVEAILEERFAEVEAVVADALAADPRDGVAIVLERMVAIQAQDQAFSDVIALRLIGAEAGERMRARFVSLIDPVVARARAAGALRPGVTGRDVAALCRMLGAMRADGDAARYVPYVLHGVAAADPAAA